MRGNKREVEQQVQIDEVGTDTNDEDITKGHDDITNDYDDITRGYN